MSSSAEFLLGLLEWDDPVFVVQEDFDGAHGEAIRSWQALGLVGSTPGAHPVPSCPRCGEGVPARIGGGLLCTSCCSGVDPRHMLAWPLEREAFLRWLAKGLGLKGAPRRHEQGLWQLGTRTEKGEAYECFLLLGPPSERGQARLDAYRNVLVLYGLARPACAGRFRRCASLVGLLRQEDGGLVLADPAQLLRTRGNVRFDPLSGALWVGDAWLGEVPPGGKEYYFLSCLAGQLDRFVEYADVKREVLGQSGCTDETEEATFCQKLKSRIKKAYVAKIDLLVVSSQKGLGYRLRGYIEL